MSKKLVALLTNNDDDIYCFRKELIEALIDNGYEVLISCPYGEKFELMDDIKYIYDNPSIDRRGTKIVEDSKLLLHYRKLFAHYKPDIVLTYTAKPNVYGSIAASRLNTPVINNYYLEIIEGLFQHRLERLFYVGSLVVKWDDDRESHGLSICNEPEQFRTDSQCEILYSMPCLCP